jgi:hypothetical protein
LIKSRPEYGVKLLIYLLKKGNRPMKINEYPQAIALFEEKILVASREVEIQTELLGFMDGEIETAIASDKALKNDQNRQAKRLEMQQQPDYLEVKVNLKAAKEDRDRALIKLNLLRNQFLVAKLEYRMQIAQLETVA